MQPELMQPELKSYQYNYPLRKNDVLVCLIDQHRIYPELSQEILLASNKYGFTYCENIDCSLQSNSNYILSHLIVVDGLDHPESTTFDYMDVINNFTSATIAMSYSSKQSFDSASPTVEKMKKNYSQINFLLPTQHGDKYIPSLDKLVDNAICDSVRIKYEPKCISKNIDKILTEHIRDFFGNVSAFVGKNSLFHRAETDGFISLRCPDGEGFFITSTKTSKTNIDLSRIAYVHFYDESSNLLAYSGNFLPSSDSVEASVIYSKMLNVSAILHTHASRQFTRNPTFSHKIAVPPMRYGESKLGDSLVSYFKSQEEIDMAIMEDHGELFLSTESQPHLAYQEIKRTIESNLRKAK